MKMAEIVHRILCCECGVSIEPNPSNMCVYCLRSHYDITENIPKQATLHFCRNCERYLQPPGEWISAALESRELLSLCVKKLRGLKDLKLVNAGFIWTEAHSKRIKVKLTVQGELPDHTLMEQVFVVEFTVQNQMCDDCHRIEAQDYWRCMVQLRQHAENRKSLYYLEQLIMKHRAHQNTLDIKPMDGGLDFYYGSDNYARKLVDFIQSTVPVRVTTSKRLISHDIHSNTFNYKYTWSVEVVPLSKDSVVCLSHRQRQQFGNLSPLCIIRKVTTGIHLIDPITTQIAEVSATSYYRSPFESIANPQQLIEYVVMDMDLVSIKDRPQFPGQGHISSRHALADIWVVRATELGHNDNLIHVRSHLGNILKIGDSVLGYSIGDSNVNNTEFDKLKTQNIPDVILVKKFYSDHLTRSNKRLWKLRHIVDDMMTNERQMDDYQAFLEDIEEDPEYRKQINVYRDTSKPINNNNNGQSMEEDNNYPHITLAEMLDDLHLNDNNDDDDDDHEEMKDNDVEMTEDSHPPPPPA